MKQRFHLASIPPNGIRLQVYLARCGVASRRGAVELIHNGFVSVNDEVIYEPSFRIFQNDRVYYQNEPIHLHKTPVYAILHKPVDYLSSNSDPHHKNFAIDLIQPYFSQRLFSIGRLDIATAGLMIFTNDGEFANFVGHPKNAVEKEYIVETQHPIPPEFIANYMAGIKYDGIRYTAKNVYRTRNNPRSMHIILHEGKNREIRTVCRAHHITIRALSRIRIGSITLKNLPPARFRKLTDAEVLSLLS